MKHSVIVPCHPRNLATLERTLQSIRSAEQGSDAETVVVHDGDSRGLSWARNRGLERATGDFVFFVDADDTVEPRYLSRLSAMLESSGADFAISSLAVAPLKRDYSLVGNEGIRRAMLPAFFGFSFDDVRRWNAGGSLFERREFGSVCRCCFRREFLERHALRFDEGLFLFEDAPFMAECACRASRTVSTAEILYDYVPSPSGLMCGTLADRRRYLDYKFAALAAREAVAGRVGAEVMDQFAGSAVFSLMELFRGRGDWRRYLGNQFVASSLTAFPVSLRHPLVAAAVLFLRLLAMGTDDSARPMAEMNNEEVGNGR